MSSGKEPKQAAPARQTQRRMLQGGIWCTWAAWSGSPALQTCCSSFCQDKPEANGFYHSASVAQQVRVISSKADGSASGQCPPAIIPWAAAMNDPCQAPQRHPVSAACTEDRLRAACRSERYIDPAQGGRSHQIHCLRCVCSAGESHQVHGGHPRDDLQQPGCWGHAGLSPALLQATPMSPPCSACCR